MVPNRSDLAEQMLVESRGIEHTLIKHAAPKCWSKYTTEGGQA